MDAAAELDAVQAAVHNQIIGKGFRKQLATGLGHDFTEDYARDDGVARKVPLAEPRVFRNAVAGAGAAIDLQGGAVQKQHGLPVGEYLFDFFPRHPLKGLKAMQALCPPKPKESEIPRVRSVFTATLGV